MYKNGFSIQHPGLIVFLVDQSISTELTVSGKNYSLGQMVSDAINGIMNMFLYENTRISAEGKEHIKNTTFFYIIGYEKNWDSADILLHEWIGNICKPFVPIKFLFKTELKQKWNNETSFVEVYAPPIEGGMSPMGSAFYLLKDIVEYWVKCHNDFSDPAPCIINITDGFPTDIDDSLDLICRTNDIMSLCVPDGNPIIFNIHITAFPDTPTIVFPQDSQLLSEELYKLLYDCSSTISSDLTDGIHLLSERKLCGTEKLFVYNVGSVLELYKYLHFSLEYAFHNYKVIRP